MSELPARIHSSAPVAAPFSVGWLYLARSIGHPSGVSALAVGLWLGAWIGGVTGSLLGLLSSLALLATASRWEYVRRLIDAHQAEREHRRRSMERDRRLAAAGPLRRAEFAELAKLVDEIDAEHPDDSKRFELQELLDYYVGLAVSHQRLVEAVQRADRSPLWEAGTARGSVELLPTTRHRKDILSRRLQHRDQCRTRAVELAEELDAISEFIHLVCEVVSCPVLDPGGQQELERRLWELEVHESALRQVSAA
jgi:hypothetical protein